MAFRGETIAVTDCRAGHDWAPVGLCVDGVLHMMCRRKTCKAEAIQSWQLTEGPGMSIDGMELDIEDDPLGTVAKTVCREAAGMYNDLDLKSGDVVVDIGAHVGIISIYLAKRYPGIRVLAYEPVKANYERMLRNIDANGADGIRALNLAVTKDGRTVTMGSNLNINSGGGSIYQKVMGPNPAVKSVSLDEIMNVWAWDPNKYVLPLPEKVSFIDRLALLKIDAEGAEYEILTADESLLDRVTYFRGEFHINKERGWDPQALRAMCERHIKPENIKLSVSQAG